MNDTPIMVPFRGYTGNRVWIGIDVNGHYSIGAKAFGRWWGVRSIWAAHPMRRAAGVYSQWGPFQVWDVRLFNR